MSIRYGWGVESRFQDLGENLTIILALRNAAAALEYYKRAGSTAFAGLHHDVSSLNDFGYELLADREVKAAISVFKWNAVAYPLDANVYDSLGEAYMDAGERDL